MSVDAIEFQIQNLTLIQISLVASYIEFKYTVEFKYILSKVHTRINTKLKVLLIL